MRVTSLTRPQMRSGGAAMWTVTATCIEGMSVELEGSEHHAGPGFGAEVGGLGWHAPALVGPFLDLLDRNGPEQEGCLALTALEGLHHFGDAVAVHDLVRGQGCQHGGDEVGVEVVADLLELV